MGGEVDVTVGAGVQASVIFLHLITGNRSFCFVFQSVFSPI